VTCLQQISPERRCAGARYCLGNARRLLKYTNERIQGGKPVAQHQANTFLMADLATELLSVRLLLDHVGRLVDEGEKDIGVEAARECR